MWINPKVRDQYQQAERSTPPEDRGERLAAIPRKRLDGADELRVSLDEFEGHQYLSLRVWSRNPQGEWWPVKGKGVSVRLSEAATVINALHAGLQLAGYSPRQEQGDRQPSPPARASNGIPPRRSRRTQPEAPGLNLPREWRDREGVSHELPVPSANPAPDFEEL